MGLMNRMSVTIVLTAALLLSAHAWVLQITNDEVEVGKTKNISLKCVNVYPLTVVSEIVRIRILKFEADEWNSVAEVSDRGNDLQTKSNNVLAEANSGAIASRFLRITWPVATNGTLGQYRCDVISLTAQENVMWHKSLPILITRKIVTVQTLSYKMEEYKQQCLKQTQDVLANATETIEVVEAELESKLESQIEVLSHTMENITEELDQLRSETEGTVETLEAGWESKLESQKQVLSQAVEDKMRFCVNQTLDLVEKLTASYELKLDDLNASYELKLDALNASYELKLDDLNASYELKLDALNASYELKLDALNASYELKLDALKRQLRVRMSCLECLYTIIYE
ncbi:uncharacterized protein LOC101854362 [Aplysia californica]|uniref:Uncharacterized protein LOC101854362 n=1 Tax=Aplysia californica TaxID=6500 RepID=A0ABM1A8G0_APLCA|nr:uncharacterized protein LOC101854362 [Aplysia californica]XP_012942830.1 uncharacterized protein LOC101854362 [Aplysia californica]